MQLSTNPSTSAIASAEGVNPNRIATQAFFERLKAQRATLAKVPLAIVAAVITKTKQHEFGNVFLVSYTQQHREVVSASEFFVVDAETTGLTPFSKPISVGASAKIGPVWTWSVYKKMYEASLNVKLRMRVWSVQLSDGTHTEAREILNYSDQGTGADMLLEAVTSMSKKAFDCIIDLIHDEVLMCVPDSDLPEIKKELERSMIAAADHVLAPYGIPAEAEGDAMTFWRKG